jgi:hypothetical protein
MDVALVVFNNLISYVPISPLIAYKFRNIKKFNGQLKIVTKLPGN